LQFKKMFMKLKWSKYFYAFNLSDVFVILRALGECSVACLKNGSSQFLFDPTTETCLFGNGTESLVTTNSQLSTTKLWIDSLSPKSKAN
jgi:hypothetical protein